ncbi:MAG: hypothetical protein F6K39_29830 [Okeania sp. SIO3B3]|nr:hypothetical protein [Okeania sp. SIO3B3]
MEDKKVRVRVLLLNQGVLLTAENTGATTLPSRASINFRVAGSAIASNQNY